MNTKLVGVRWLEQLVGGGVMNRKVTMNASALVATTSRAARRSRLVVLVPGVL